MSNPFYFSLRFFLDFEEKWNEKALIIPHLTNFA